MTGDGEYKMRKKIGTLWMAGVMLLSQIAGPMAGGTVVKAAAGERNTTVTVYDYVDMSGTTAAQITSQKNLHTQQTSADNQAYGWTLGNAGEEGYVDLSLHVAQNKYNYITVKLWGNDKSSDSVDGSLYIAAVVKETYLMGADEADVTPITSAGALPDRNYMVALSNLSDTEQYQDGYIYSTYYIPQSLVTQAYADGGNGTVSLRLYSAPSGKYYSSTGVSETQTAPSRTLYGLWVTTEPCVSGNITFVDETGNPVDISLDVRGQASAPASSPYQTTDSAQMETCRQTIKEYAKLEIDIFKNRQIYGGTNYPGYMEGQMTRNTAWKSEASDADWKTKYYRQDAGMLAQNLTPINGLEAFAHAYTSDFYTEDVLEKQELFARMIAGLDFLVRAQGSNGGFTTYSTDGLWVGASAPTGTSTDYDGRLLAYGNNLSGFGLRSAAQAFLLIAKDSDGKAALEQVLTENVTDYNADGNEDPEAEQVNRAIAYGVMFANARDHLTNDISGTGHAPNQDMANMIAALRFDQGCKIIDDYLESNTSIERKVRRRQYQKSKIKSDDSKSVTAVYEDKEYGYPYSWEHTSAGLTNIKETIERGLGYRISTAYKDYWISKKGMILENLGSLYGSYSGDYGTAAIAEVSDIAEMAENYYKANYPVVFSEDYNKVLNQVYDAIQPYYFIQNRKKTDGTEEPVLYSEGVVSHRNCYYPGTERYVVDIYGTMLDQNQYPEASTVSGAILKYYLEHGRVNRNASGYTNSGDAHFEDNAIEIMKLYKQFDQVLSHVNSAMVQGYQFPSQSNTDKTAVYADEMARNVVIQDNGETYYIALNWRNWMHSDYKIDLELGNPVEIYAHNLARIHHTGQGFDQIGYARGTSVDIATCRHSNAANELYHESRYLEGLMSLRYGKYTIIMNTNGTTDGEYGYQYKGHGNTYTLSQSGYSFDENTFYKDLVTGTVYDGADLSAVTIQPETTMVLVTTEAALTADMITSYAVSSTNGASTRENSADNTSSASDVYYLNEIVTTDETKKAALVDGDTSTTDTFGQTRIVFIDMGDVNVTRVELYGAASQYCFATGSREAPASVTKDTPIVYRADAAIRLNNTTGYNTGTLKLNADQNNVLTITSKDMDFGRYLILDMNNHGTGTIAEIRVYSEEDREAWDLVEVTNQGLLSQKRLSEVTGVLEPLMGDTEEWPLYQELTYNQKKSLFQTVSSKTDYKKSSAVVIALKSEINRVTSVQETESGVGLATIGAQIRDVADQKDTSGTTQHDFRFRSLIQKDICTAVEEKGGEFGTIIIPTQALTLAGVTGLNFTLNENEGISYNNAVYAYARIRSKVFYEEHQNDDTISYKEFTGVLTGLTEAYRGRSFTARAYYIPADCLDSNGAVINYDGILYGRPVTRRICTVAQTTLDSETTLTEQQGEVLRELAYVSLSGNATTKENEVDTDYWGGFLQN